MVAHPIIDAARRAQHQHRRTHLLLPQRLDDGEAVHSRRHSIDDHGIGPAGSGLVEAFDPAGAPFGLVAALLEFGDDLFGGVLLSSCRIFVIAVFPRAADPAPLSSPNRSPRLAFGVLLSRAQPSQSRPSYAAASVRRLTTR
jgi:hypothetical protein